MLGAALPSAACSAALLRRRTQRPKACVRTCVAQAKPTPPSGPGGAPKKPAPRGPGQAPLRMQTEDQKKFGYGGDNCARNGRAAAPCMRARPPAC
jgi:hypothetical protein